MKIESKQLTLCMIFRDDKILLGMKKRGFGEGRWNGFGGKVEAGETIETAAIRELREEVNLKPLEMDKVGIIQFSFRGDPQILEVHIFKITDFEGKPVETEEMKPQWFELNQIPFQQMWSDDKYWFPYLLSGKLFRGKFNFEANTDNTTSPEIISQDLVEVGEL